MSDTDLDAVYRQATVMTGKNLQHLATTMEYDLKNLSQLELPEIQRITDEIARVVPAGNVPSMILSGLVRLKGRTVEPDDTQNHIKLLFRGVRLSLDRALYTTFFAGPAAVLYGYQQLLRLTGKEPDAAFPEGTWQFYLEFALREDSARHANETIGFQTKLREKNIDPAGADALGAWITATARTVDNLPHILENEWRERVMFRLLNDTVALHQPRKLDDVTGLYRLWENQRPFGRVNEQDYATHRRVVFESFWQQHTKKLNRKVRAEFETQYSEWVATKLPAYLRQMSWLARLVPDTHNEIRQHYSIDRAMIGVIWQGRYFLMPLADMRDPDEARRVAAAILNRDLDQPTASLDDALVEVTREEHATLRDSLDAEARADLDNLSYAPVLINWDERDNRLPLAYIRRGKRGVGDHALTIFRTQESTVFDQSHIFFDGVWGASMAQTMTYEATYWATHINDAVDVRPARRAIVSPRLQIDDRRARNMTKHRILVEASAENRDISLKAIVRLRKLLKQRSDIAQVTVNDLLILYRSLHAVSYQPSPDILAELERISKSKLARDQEAYVATRDALYRLRNRNPAILIPLDASRHDPRERVFPTTFRNPLTDFYEYHQATWQALQAYRDAEQGDEAGRREMRRLYADFQEKQLTYLRMLGGFGQVLTQYKQVAMTGQSTSTATLKTIGGLPRSIQRLLNEIPGRFDVLNEVIRGEEVFSNVGQVARGSSLRRFITAKDDNRQKTFSWGVITDDSGIVHVTLRDFRLHVGLLYRANREKLAHQIVQDYLDRYVTGLNLYVEELREITVTSAEAQTERRRGIFG